MKRSRRRIKLTYEKENRYLGGDPFVDAILFSIAAYLSIGLSSLLGIFHPLDFWENFLGFVVVPYLSGLGVSSFLFVVLKILIPTLGHSLHPEWYERR